MNVREIILRILFQMYSIGFRSGEYGGKYTSLTLFISAYSRVIFAWWDRKLSRMITISAPEFIFRIVWRNSPTSSFFEWSWNSRTEHPLIEQNPNLFARNFVVFFISVGWPQNQSRCVFAVVCGDVSSRNSYSGPLSQSCNNFSQNKLCAKYSNVIAQSFE